MVVRNQDEREKLQVENAEVMEPGVPFGGGLLLCKLIEHEAKFLDTWRTD